MSDAPWSNLVADPQADIREFSVLSWSSAGTPFPPECKARADDGIACTRDAGHEGDLHWAMTDTFSLRIWGRSLDEVWNLRSRA